MYLCTAVGKRARPEPPSPEKPAPETDMATRIEIQARKTREKLESLYEAYKASHKGRSSVILEDLDTLLVSAECDEKRAKRRANR